LQELRDYLALLPAMADELLPHGSPVAGKSIILLKPRPWTPIDVQTWGIKSPSPPPPAPGTNRRLHRFTDSVEPAQPAPLPPSSRLACAAADSPCWVRVRGRGEKRREKDRERKQSEPRATLTPHVSRMRQGQYGPYEKCFRIRTPARWAIGRCKRT